MCLFRHVCFVALCSYLILENPQIVGRFLPAFTVPLCSKQKVGNSLTTLRFRKVGNSLPTFVIFVKST